MGIVIKLYTDFNQEEEIYSRLQKKIKESQIDTRRILFLKQIINPGERAYFSVKNNEKEIYSSSQPRTFNLENSFEEIELLIKFLKDFKE